MGGHARTVHRSTRIEHNSAPGQTAILVAAKHNPQSFGIVGSGAV
jgi:hypothetical protein